MAETREQRLIRQRGDHYRKGKFARQRNRYRHDDAYREKRKAQARAYYARKRGDA